MRLVFACPPRLCTIYSGSRVLLACLLLAACSGNGRREVRAYYFPVLDLQEGKVYAYASTGPDSSAPEYWYFRTTVRDSGVFLRSTYYDANFQIGQITREKIVDNGALARDYFLYDIDTTTGRQIQMIAHIDAANVFPFEVTDSAGVFLFGLHYHPANDSLTTIYLVRNRRFLGDGPDFHFQGRTYPTVRFSLRDAIGNEREGAAEIEGIGEEWYAKGLGLVYYRKVYGSSVQVKLEYRLREIMEIEDLELRAKEWSDQ